MTNHRNDERTVRCPVEGCGKEVLARGLHLHVRQSAGDGHGPQGDIPGHISLDNLETVGEQEVEMDYPEERDTENVARLCPYCSQTFVGVQGLMIHLGQTAGRKNHPENPKDRHEPGDFPRVEVDAEGNVQQAVDTATTASAGSHDDAVVPTARVFELIADLVAEGDAQTAHRVRRHLLASDNPDRPLRTNIPGPKLYNALLMQTTDESESKVSAVLESEGIMVACRGESAFYDAEAALDVAAGLEQAGSVDEGNEEITDLIEFLRYGANLLKGGDVEKNRHEEFDRWR